MTQQLEDIGEVTESRTFHQLGILVLDGSNSMNAMGDGNRSLAENVNHAVREFLTYFKGSSIVNNFSLAVVGFGVDSKIHTPITPLTKIDDFSEYDPTKVGIDGNGTYIGGALAEAQKLSDEFLSSPDSASIPHDVRIIVMSDGLCGAPEQTKVISDQIKQNDKVMICSALFTDRSKVGDAEVKEAKTVLADIASAANLYKTVYGEGDLRQFFISSMSAKRKFGNEQ